MTRPAKRLGYRCQIPTTQDAQAAHWAGFEWWAGPCKVSYVGEWGAIQVWARDETEARRVIAHACEAAGINPSDPQGEYLVATMTHPRYQRVRLMRTAVRLGRPVVTMRAGPDGLPMLPQFGVEL